MKNGHILFFCVIWGVSDLGQEDGEAAWGSARVIHAQQIHGIAQ